MNDKSVFNICACLGMFVTMLIIVGFIKHFGAIITAKHIIIMTGIVLAFGWFADVFLKIFGYFLMADAIGYRFLSSYTRENFFWFKNEDLKEFHWGEKVTVLSVIIIGYYLMNEIIFPYAGNSLTSLKLSSLFFVALWLGGFLIGGLFYVVFQSGAEGD